jgi:hypothetical protein
MNCTTQVEPITVSPYSYECKNEYDKKCLKNYVIPIVITSDLNVAQKK